MKRIWLPLGIVIGSLGLIATLIGIRGFIANQISFLIQLFKQDVVCHPAILVPFGLVCLLSVVMCWLWYRPNDRSVLRALTQRYGLRKTEYHVVTKLNLDGSAEGTVTQVIENRRAGGLNQLEYNYYTNERPDDQQTATIYDVIAVGIGQTNAQKTYKVQYSPSNETNHWILGTFRFVPSIMTGEKVRLKFTRFAPEKTFLLKSTGKTKEEYSSQKVSFPMEHLSMSVVFPAESFFPNSWGVRVYYCARRKVICDPEQERLRKSRPCFQDPNAPLVLRMELPFPVIGLQYELWWELPV